MIPKEARLNILGTIVAGLPFMNMCVELFTTNYTGTAENAGDADLVTTPSRWVTPVIPDPAFDTLAGWIAAHGINSASEGEWDTVLLTFEATGSFSPFHVYGYKWRFRTSGGGSFLLYGYEKFTDPVAINSAGDKVKFYANLYDQDFTPTGHL